MMLRKLSFRSGTPLSRAVQGQFFVQVNTDYSFAGSEFRRENNRILLNAWREPEEERTARQKLASVLAAVDVPAILQTAKHDKGFSIDGNETVFSAVAKMAARNVGAVIVRGGHSRGMVGIFTERDYIRKIALQGKSSKETKVSDVMTPNVTTVSMKDSLYDIMGIVAERRIRHFPVREFLHGNLTGPVKIVSSKDLCAAYLEAVRTSVVDPFAMGTVQDVFNKVKQGMTQNVDVQADDTVYMALQWLAENKLGGVWVTEGQKIAGMFTERDYLHKVILQNRSSRNTQLRDVMTPAPIHVAAADDSVMEVLQTMVEGNFRHMPVIDIMPDDTIDAESRLVSLLTMIDCIKYLYKVPEASGFVSVPEDSETSDDLNNLIWPVR